MEGCEHWGRAVFEAVIADKPALVVTSSFSCKELVDDKSGRSRINQYIDGFGAYWQGWPMEATSWVWQTRPHNVDVRTPIVLVGDGRKLSHCDDGGIQQSIVRLLLRQTQWCSQWRAFRASV